MKSKLTLSLLFPALLAPSLSQSTTFTFGGWDGIYIDATVTNPTDDMNSLAPNFNCSSTMCSYGRYLYVIKKDGSRTNGGGSNSTWLFWNVKGREQIINYLQKKHYTESMRAYFPQSVKPEDVLRICLEAKVMSNSTHGPRAVISDTCLSGGGTVPPIPGQPFCETSDQIELQHGIVYGRDAAGHRITKTITFTCNGNISSTLAIMNSDVTMSGPSSDLTSKVLIDGESQLKLNMSEGINTYPLSSELNTTTEIKPGNYQGNTVLTWLPD